MINKDHSMPSAIMLYSPYLIIGWEVVPELQHDGQTGSPDALVLLHCAKYFSVSTQEKRIWQDAM